MMKMYLDFFLSFHLKCLLATPARLIRSRPTESSGRAGGNSRIRICCSKVANLQETNSDLKTLIQRLATLNAFLRQAQGDRPITALQYLS